MKRRPACIQRVFVALLCLSSKSHGFGFGAKFLLLGTSLLLVFPTLCSGEEKQVSEVKESKSASNSPPPYSSEGKRDPFVPTNLSQTDGAQDGAPLERYSLSQLRLTAVLLDEKKGSTAIIEDGSGKGFTVRIGSRIGDRGGELITIERDRIQIRERTVDFTGKEREEVVEMKLPPPSATASEKAQRKRPN